MKITLKQLADAKACREQRELFARTFGKSVEVTRELCVSVADKFDFEWAATHLLSAQALAEYKRDKAAAWAEYERAKVQAFADAYNGVQA